ncbi:MAG TPA: hypothetical protein VF765_36120 [Polyangiaceae bacterium]
MARQRDLDSDQTVKRQRNTDSDQTVRRRIDVAKAFGEQEETPTRPAVHAQVPLDAVPILALPRGEVPWDKLGEKASQVMLRVDGTTCVMVIATDTGLPPADVASELASLVTHGLVHLVAPPSTRNAELELDLAAG